MLVTTSFSRSSNLSRMLIHQMLFMNVISWMIFIILCINLIIALGKFLINEFNTMQKLSLVPTPILVA